LLGTSFFLEVKAYSSYYEDIQVSPISLAITLSTTGPDFSTAPTASDLSCGPSAGDWEMELPEVRLNE